MYESGSSALRRRQDIQEALRRLEQALSRQEGELRACDGDARDPALQALYRSIELMREEANRLRSMLAAP